MEVVETDVRMDVDGKMDIDMSTDQPRSELQIASITFGSALDLLPRQTCSSAVDAMDVDLMSPSTTAASPAGTISQESLEKAEVSASLSVSQFQSQSQRLGSQTLSSPTSSESQEKPIPHAPTSSESGTSSSSSYTGGTTPEVIPTPTSVLTSAAAAAAPLPLDGGAASSLVDVSGTARFVDAGNLDSDIDQDEDDQGSEVDELLNEARRVGDEGRRKELYTQAMEILHEDVPYVYLYHSNTTTDFAMQSNVKGFTAYPDGILRLANVSKQQ